MANNTQKQIEMIEKFIDLLKLGKIKPDHEVKGSDDWGTTKFSLIQNVLNVDDLDVSDKKDYIKQLIDLGCDVDHQVSAFTSLEFACAGSSNRQDYKPIVALMLEHHKFGDLSDMNILKTSAKSLDLDMLEFVVRSGKVDINTISKGNHILHYLADDQSFNVAISTIVDIAPDVKVNEISRHGYSPLTIAVNKGNHGCIIALKKREDAKLIGMITMPQVVVARDIVSRYDGNFFSDFPAMVEYAISVNKTDLLPQELTDIFMF